jgi:hypothetical protein
MIVEIVFLGSMYRNFKVTSVQVTERPSFKKKDTTEVVNSNMFDIWHFSKTLCLCLSRRSALTKTDAFASL